jgi:hypothetical protein
VLLEQVVQLEEQLLQLPELRKKPLLQEVHVCLLLMKEQVMHLVIVQG